MTKDDNFDIQSALNWKSYTVRRSDKEPLLNFVLEALSSRGCRVIYASPSNRAPFYVVFDTPKEERHGVLIYAFFANANLTKNRPADEHRFQIKYGGNLKGVLDVEVDSRRLVTTLLVGIDPHHGIFVAADPLMNTPAPMSRSVEFKSHHVAAIKETGWFAWERDRRPGKSKSRPTAELDDLRTEVLVGGVKERLLDLILLERISLGLDPGERHLVADKMRVFVPKTLSGRHPVLDELGVESDQLLSLIEGASRLKMAVRGWVAEQHLFDALLLLDGVSHCERLEVDGKPDVSLRWRGSEPILVECKNTLRTTYADGRPKVDFQKTRASKGDPCSRYYRPSDFPVLAACLHSVTERWEFRFALTADLEPHKKCVGRISSSIAVAEPVFTDRVEALFDRYIEYG